MAPWLQFFLASEGSKLILPRTSYGAPRPVGQQPTSSPQGPSAGYQRPTPEGYKIPPAGKYRDPDAGIRGQFGSALDVPAFMLPQHQIY